MADTVISDDSIAAFIRSAEFASSADDLGLSPRAIRAGLRAAITQWLAERRAVQHGDPQPVVEAVVQPSAAVNRRHGVRLTRYRWVHLDGITAKCDLASALTAVAEHGGRIDRSYVIAGWDRTEVLGAWETYIPDGAVVQVAATEPAEPLAPAEPAATDVGADEHNGCCSMSICVVDRNCPGYATCTEGER